MCFGSAVTLFAADAEVTCPGTGAVHTKDNCKYTPEEFAEPLCGKNGYTLYACDICGAHFIDEIKEQLGDCKEFEFVAEVPATCGEDGVLAHEKCVVCKKVRLNGTVENKDGQINGVAVKEALKIAKTSDHVWGAWTETATGKTRKCTVEGCTGVETHTHKFEISSMEVAPDATMDNPGKAKAVCECGKETEVNVYPVHACKDYVTEIKKVDATCTSEGVTETYYVCKCGKAYSDKAATTLMSEEAVAKNITAKHSKTLKTAVTPATCTTYGMIGDVCTKCGAQVGEVEVIAPTGHEYLTYPADVTDSDGNVIHKKGDVIVSYDKSSYKDTEAKVETRYCVHVEKDTNDDYKDYRTYETDVLSSTHSISVIDENGVSITVNLADAVKAGEVKTTVEAEGHKAVAYTTPADCQHGAFTFWYCTNDNCSLEAKSYVEDYEWKLNGETVKKTYRTTDADYNALKVIPNAKGTEWSVATRNYVNTAGKTETVKVDGKDVTKQEEATAKDVHAVYTESAKTAATCIKAGVITGKCSCGTSVSVVLDKIAHVYELKKENEPTCSKTGKYTCTTEGCTATVEIPKLAFTPVTGVLTKTEHDAKVKAEGHNVSTKVTTQKTCTTDEITTATCTSCKKTWSYVSGAADGHKMPDGFTGGGYVLKKSSDGKKVEAYAVEEHYEYYANEAITVNSQSYAKGAKIGDGDVSAAGLASKTAAELTTLKITKKWVGAKTAAYFCAVCDEFIASETKNGGHTITTDGNGGAAKAAVHTAEKLEDGLKEGWYQCSVCNACILENGTSAVITAAHSWKDVAAKAATCTTEGYTKYKYCTVCGLESGKSVVSTTNHHDSKGVSTITVLGDYSEATAGKDCAAEKYVYNYCSACKTSWIDGYVAATAHDSKTTIKAVAATCTTSGNTAGTKCSVCGKNQVGGEVIPATGHEDAEGVFYPCNQKGRICQNATCKTSLYKAGTTDKNKTVANRIAFTKNEDHKATGSNIEIITETCTTAGGTVYTCDWCNTVYKVENPTAALGHDMQLSKTLVAATEVSGGKELWACARAGCDVTETVETPKLSDLKLNISVDNAVVAGAEIVESGKVKVTVSISSRDSAIWGTNFSVKYAAGMLSFVGFENASEGLFTMQANAVTRTEEKEVDEKKVTVKRETGEVKVVAYAEDNKETNKSENVNISGEVKLIDLYFNVVGDTNTTDENDGEKKENKTTTITISEAHGSTVDAESVTVAVADAEKEGNVTVKPIADIDGTGYVDINDLSKLLGLKNYRKYDAAADLNKDGSVDQRDFDLLYNYLSGEVTWDEIVVTLKAAE